MKDWHNIVIGVVLVTIVLAYETVYASTDGNIAMKRCLQAYGYSQEKFDTFDWSEAARCHSDYRVAQTEIRNQETRDFLKKNPWFRGPNWNWQDRAEWTCHAEYHTGETFCHRPYYIQK